MTWKEKIEEVLKDEEKTKIGAALYLLVFESVHMPIERKRTSREEMLWDEANRIVKRV